jgi:hypothetical protein
MYSVFFTKNNVTATVLFCFQSLDRCSLGNTIQERTTALAAQTLPQDAVNIFT